MISTLQVRTIIRKHFNSNSPTMWTNKTKGHKGLNRRVKCYAFGNYQPLLSELRSAAGAMNVTVGGGGYYCSIIVKCVLA